MENDTITAIATGLKAAGISIIRLSGSQAFEIADRVFRSVSGKTVQEMKSYTVSYGHIIKKDSLSDKNENKDAIIDEVLLIKMAAPSTYTREDVVEIDCHGGIIVTKKVLETVIAAGARLAEPGEFTKRAFLNGRIDLSQAEAVSDLISSESESAVINSIRQLNGNIRDKISELRNKLLTKTAYIEAALDDPEHISLEGFDDELSETIKDVYFEINKLIKSFDNGRIIKNGINTVILGSPNVGKSSIMNRLLGKDRAIVTDIPGTTRDTLSESVIIGGNIKNEINRTDENSLYDGIRLNIIDTAGIRETDDVIEKIGVDRARKAAEEADLILFVIDISRDGMTESEIKELSGIKDKKTIIILNKSDLGIFESSKDVSNKAIAETGDEKCSDDGYKGSVNCLQTDPETEQKQGTDSLFKIIYEITGCQPFIYNSENTQKPADNHSINVVQISAKTGEGIEDLENCISRMFFTEEIDSDDNIYISNLRHKILLDKASKSLENVMKAIEQGLSEDFYTIDLMDAYTSLGLITGEHVEDELANKIFSEFCMGK